MSKLSIATLRQRVPNDPEINLWRAVILQHLRDAVFDSESFLSGERSPRKIKCVTAYFIRSAKARVWFRDSNESFDYVCDLADLEPSVVRKWAVQAIKDFDQYVSVTNLTVEQLHLRNTKGAYEYEQAGDMDTRIGQGMAEGGGADGAFVPQSAGVGSEHVLA